MAAHTLAHDARQVQFHYDLSDDFYAQWLDPRRVYACACYQSPDLTLAQAQEAKLDHICRKLQLQPGDGFLDIGAAGAACCCGRPNITGWMQPASRCRATSTRMCSGSSTSEG